MSLAHILTTRGFVNQFSAEKLSDITDAPEKRTVYFGVDPTADSIHAGNLVGYMLMRHLADAGHKVIMLAGGGTGMIGDPKPDVERPLLPRDEIARRVDKLKKQAEKVLNIPELVVVDNYDWLGKLGLIEFLRDIGKHFTVNNLMKKDAIATRLQSDDGISYTEFSYPLLQAYDYLHLNREHGCDLQIGGSDQWGNIVAGVDLIRRKEGKTAYALTMPLIVDKATGKKFGKSEGNAVWLDAEKTSPYAFYQFWLNSSDESVIDYLKIFTLLSLDEISEIELDHTADKGKRSAQRKLAYEVTAFIHGKAEAESAQHITQILFGDVSVESVTDVSQFLKSAPHTAVAIGDALTDVLVTTGLASSKREARQFIESNAILMNNAERVSDVQKLLHENDFFANGLALIKRGKQKVAVLVKN